MGAFLLALAAWMLTAAASPSPAASPAPSPTPRPSPSSSPSPSPTPIPSPPGLQLNLSSGLPGATVVVNGSGFPAGAQVLVFWDEPGNALINATATDGTFVAAFVIPSAAPGAHLVCVQTPARSCATFTVLPPASPTPTPSVATPPPTPSAAPTASARPSGGATTPAPTSGGLAARLASSPLAALLVGFLLLAMLATIGAVVTLVAFRRDPDRPNLDDRAPILPLDPGAAAPTSTTQATAPPGQYPPPPPAGGY